jgi:hypothetical protein
MWPLWLSVVVSVAPLLDYGRDMRFSALIVGAMANEGTALFQCYFVNCDVRAGRKAMMRVGSVIITKSLLGAAPTVTASMPSAARHLQHATRVLVHEGQAAPHATDALISPPSSPPFFHWAVQHGALPWPSNFEASPSRHGGLRTPPRSSTTLPLLVCVSRMVRSSIWSSAPALRTTGHSSPSAVAATPLPPEPSHRQSLNLAESAVPELYVDAAHMPHRAKGL